MNKSKILRVDMDLDLVRDLIILCIDNPDNPTLARLGRVLDDKLNRAVNRELYSRSKMAATPEARELARQEYLDRKGVPNDYRWPADYKNTQRDTLGHGDQG